MQNHCHLANFRSAQLMRAVMLWLMLAFTAALAAPVVQPQSMELLCSGSGSIKLLVGGSDEADKAAAMPADCALCPHASAPPPVRSNSLTVNQPAPFYTLPAASYSLPVRLTSPPLPARGPPGAAHL